MSIIQLEQLTKKNQEFIHTATNQLIRNGQSNEEIKTLLEGILPTLLENQKKGITARSLYGSPSTWVAQQTQVSDSPNQENENDNPWLMWLDSSLLILALFGLLNGVMNYLGQGTSYGVLTLFVISFGVGAGMYVMYHLNYRNPDKRTSMWKVIGVLFLTTLSWSVVFLLSALIPTSINPILLPSWTIAIGAIAFALRYLLRKKYHIRNAMQPAPRR